MKSARRHFLIAFACLGATLLLSDATAFAAKRKAAVLKTKRAGDYAVAQIRPALSRKARSSLSDFKPFHKINISRCIKPDGRAASSGKSIADALLEPPSPATIELLTNYGVPVIDGVPPIFILFPDEQKGRETVGF
jgi:hypothetical protein